MLWTVIILILFIVQVATVLIAEFRHPNKTIAWLFILFILPIIGFVMYYFVAKEYTQRKKVRRTGRALHDELHRDFREQTPLYKEQPLAFDYEIQLHPRLFGLLRHMPGSTITRFNRVEVLADTAIAYKEMMTAIQSAKKHIHFQFYTIRNDRIGTQFMELLIQKAREGIQVRVIYDGIGSYQLSNRYIQKLREGGVEVHPFLPPMIAFFDKRMNYRNHRKIVVVDGREGFLGGMNVGDEYLGGNPRLGFWRDTHMKLYGDSVYDLQRTFLHDWYFVSHEKLADASLFPKHDISEESPVQIIASGPDAHWDSILEMFFGSLAAAERNIYITTPYFIPEGSITMALKTAANSGVDVRILLPYACDSRLVQYASRSYYQELLQAGVRIFLYHKGFIHAKTVIVDRKMATAGSANMDMRSFFSNFELNAVFYDQAAISRLESDFMSDLQECKELELAEFEERSRLERGKEVVARLLSPLF